MVFDPLIIPSSDGTRLQAFADIAAKGSGRVVLDESSLQGNLVFGRQPTGFGRFVAWLKGPSAEESKENAMVLAQFRDCLISKYDEKVARNALAASGIKLSGPGRMQKCQNLSSSLIVKILAKAEDMAQLQRIGNEHRANHYLDRLFKNPEIARLGAQERRSLRNAIGEVIKADPRYFQHNLTDSDLSGLAMKGMEAWHLKAGSDSLSEKNVAHARGLWFKAAVLVLNEAAKKRETLGDHAGAGRLRELRNELQQQSAKELSAASDDRAQSLDKALKNLPKELETTLKVVFKERGLSAENLEGKLHHAHIKVLNQEQEWSPVSKRLSFVLNESSHVFSSTICPASQMPKVFNHPYAQGSGVCSATTDSADHAVNLAASELLGDNGEVVFRGVRHGVNSAFGLRGGDRLSANACRTEECVLAALASRPGLLKQALANPREPVRLELSSISLLTPDYFRTHIQHSENSSEKAQMEEQFAAWSGLKPLPGEDFVRYTVMNSDTRKPEIIRIKLDVLPFNFGVNEGAVEGKFGMSSERDMVSGWGFAQATNEASLTKLFGRLDTHSVLGGKVGEFLERHDVSQQDKEIVKTLSDQIRKIWADGSYMHGGNDPYKMVARLAVLTHKIDGVPLWNCKSGKDRTGMLDVEAKFLAARIAVTGIVPEPGGPLTESEKRVYREFALQSGNHEIQRYNTGLGGFKTEGVRGVDARIGDEFSRELHRGGSKYVKD